MSWDTTDQSLHRTTRQLLKRSSVVVVGRLDATSVSPGNHIFSGTGPDDELLWSTYFVRLRVEQVLKDDATHPLGPDVLLELTLPSSLDPDDIAGTVPIGHSMLIAGSDGTDKGDWHVLPAGTITTTTRFYNPLVQGVVIEADAGRYATVASWSEEVFADPGIGELASFGAVVDAVEHALP